MSIIIKGMEMPKNCKECKMWSICECLNDFEDFESICYAVEDGDLIRDKNCPLVEIPTPHGDLVDRNELLTEYDRQHEGEAGKARKIMEQTKTVIEAEGETNGR